MTLTLENVSVDLRDNGAAIAYMGGRLWLRRDALTGSALQVGDYATVTLRVELREVRTQSATWTAVLVRSVESCRKK